MPDTNDRIDAPGDWQQALAALSLESPPPGGWDRIASRLPQPKPQRQRWPVAVAVAIAATLAIIAIVPALWWRTSVPEPATPVAASPAGSRPLATPATVAAGRPIPITAQTLPSSPSPQRSMDSNDSAVVPAASIAAATPATRRPARNAIAADALAGGERATAASAHAQLPPATEPALESLYVESAHLESLLAQIQDERVANGPAMAMAGALQDRIAAIDHALSQPGNDIEQRALWQQRVEALRQLAGLEGTQRWLAASGNAGNDDSSRIY